MDFKSKNLKILNFLKKVFQFIKNLIKDVKFIGNFDVKKVINTKDQLKLLIDDQGNSLKAKTVIWANGYEMKNVSNNIPINSISGQVTYLKENKAYKNLKLNFSYGHHFSQAFGGYHQIGSSFNRNEDKNYKEIDQIDTSIKLSHPNFANFSLSSILLWEVIGLGIPIVQLSFLKEWLSTMSGYSNKTRNN